MRSGRGYYLAVNNRKPLTEEVRLMYQWLVNYQPLVTPAG
ncbi:hypothetical protein GCM10022394_04860 [Zobellella aerophila]|uniref:LysR substrate-binding domain-containing protein n=1 Tax=Zobellella aerophila TaxID=870480 RepID=A0ABP6V988_9GAMM